MVTVDPDGTLTEYQRTPNPDGKTYDIRNVKVLASKNTTTR